MLYVQPAKADPTPRPNSTSATPTDEAIATLPETERNPVT
jgi:hypothetical protein